MGSDPAASDDSSGNDDSSADGDPGTRNDSGTADDHGRGEGSPRPDCPRCGTPVGFVTATGPMTASVTPCGCTVPPALVQRDD